MDRRLDLDVLRTLVAIADGGSFSAAADRIGRTQSAVSMQIRRLEEATGKRLFDRGTRHVRATPAGESLLGHARRMLRLEEEAWAALVEPDLSGRVRLGIPDDYAYALLPPVLSRFAASHPKVEVELICEQSTLLDGRLAEGSVDLAVVTRGLGRIGELLRREPLVWFAAADHDAHRLDPLPVALYEPGCVARDVTLRALDADQRPYRVAYSSPSLVGLMAVGALVRSWFVQRHQGVNAWPLLVGVALLLVALIAALAPRPAVSTGAEAGAPVSLAQVQAVVAQRCQLCHNAQLAQKGVQLHSAALIEQHAQAIYQQAVLLKTMPLNNATGITDEERALLARWYLQRR